MILTSAQSMISSFKNNRSAMKRRSQKKFYNKYKQEFIRRQIDQKKATPEQMAEIRKKIEENKKSDFRKSILAVVLTVVILVLLPILLSYLFSA